MSNKLIILDRDGVINLDSDQYIKSPEEWIPIQSSLRAIANLNREGYKVAVATNQSGIAREKFDTTTLAMIHKKMELVLANVGAHINALEYCPDHPNQAGPNRKPNTGMVNKLLILFDADASETWFVGDSISDLQCASSAGCKGVLVLTGNGKNTIGDPAFNKNTPVFQDLDSFVEQLISAGKNNLPSGSLTNK